jgi:sugar-phosphatase
MVVECAAILFDMDGTLVDSTLVVERQWKKFANRHGLDYARIMQISHGRRNAETIREIAPHLATRQIFEEFDAEELEDRQGLRTVKGAARIIGQLADHEWAVVTSASQALAANRLQAVDLPVPKVLIGAEDVREGKPDPEGYLTAAHRLGVAPELCVAFEDTVPGLEAARASGAQAIGITTTFPRTELEPAACITDFEEVAIDRAASGHIRLTLAYCK